MKIRRGRRFDVHVSTSSLNDIMFFLLLFFLIISTLANPNVIKILLPQAKASDVMQKHEVTLTVTADKEYFIDKRQIVFDNLENELVSLAANSPDQTIILRMEADLSVQDLVDVLEIGAKNHLRMVMATDKTK